MVWMVLTRASVTRYRSSELLQTLFNMREQWASAPFEEVYKFDDVIVLELLQEEDLSVHLFGMVAVFVHCARCNFLNGYLDRL